VTGILTAAQETVSGAVIFKANTDRRISFHRQLACTDSLLAGATCLFNPPIVALAGTAAATTTLSIALAALRGETLNAQVPASASEPGLPRQRCDLSWFDPALPPRRNRHRKSSCTLIVVVFAASALGFITGCGSGVSLTGAGQSANTVGIYAVTVTAARRFDETSDDDYAHGAVVFRSPPSDALHERHIIRGLNEGSLYRASPSLAPSLPHLPQPASGNPER